MNRTSMRALVRRIVHDTNGSATAEYAIATLAAVGFAGLLVVILRSDAVRSMLTNLIQHALSYSG
jgi:Flp pilus assembly pilin Flp